MRDRITRALAAEVDEETAREIAFHLTDWSDELAFLDALRRAPETFTVEEIRSGVTAFLIHAPNHIAAAAKLAGWPIDDIFEVGALDGQDHAQ